MAKDNTQQLALTVKKEDDMSEWYTQVIQKADLIEYTDVSGCIIFKPDSYQIWEAIRDFFDIRIKKSGVRNAYFPLFIPERLLTKEKDHVEGFAPEVAWVTHGGKSELKERLAIRPTSETIIGDTYAKWIRSYRDLPLRLNLWNNVVRWEFKHPTPFLRTREFLWQEGHTLFETKGEAWDEVLEIQEYYRQVAEDLLAIPVDKGRKSVGEKFAGADISTTIETFLTDGKAIQAGTSHLLGQNFAKAFDIEFLDKNQKKQHPWQNSWGISTRIIGAMIMAHGDNKGLVLPPKVAFNKVVIVPLLFKGKEEAVLDVAHEIKDKLSHLGAIVDDRDNYSPGFKFAQWEMKGIPLRVEIGPRDLENGKCIVVSRDEGVKVDVSLDDKEFVSKFEGFLDRIQSDMLKKARDTMNSLTVEVDNFKDFEKAISEKKRCLVPWFEDVESEDKIQEKTGAKSSCIPFEFEKRSLKGKKCFYSGKEATVWAYFCRSH